ncbi:MAG: GTP-binding protein [Candidatus Lokiarchaeota archaeon]|nr:GTP-binding protein [Candidatus Lokiarchaeota archaeon]
MSEKIAAFLTEKTIKKDTVLDLPCTAIKGCTAEIAKTLETKGYKKIGDLIKIKNLDDVTGKKSELDIVVIEKMVTAARIIDDFAKGKKATDKKIVVVGLDNAGKTSIIQTLLDPKTDKKDAKPTQGLAYENVDVFGYDLSVWDFGGQESYRQQYLTDKEKSFGYTDIFIFVFDISEKKRFKEAVDYLKSIVDIYKFLGESPISIICLHKSDLISPKELAKVKSGLLEDLSSVLGELRFSTYATSIFDNNSIFTAFSSGFREISPVKSIIEKILDNFQNKIKSEYIAFFNATGICVAEVGEGKNKDLSKNFSFNVILGEELEVFPDEANKIILALNDNKYCILERIKSKKEKFYLSWVSSETPEILSKEPLIDEMKPWIENFF